MFRLVIVAAATLNKIEINWFRRSSLSLSLSTSPLVRIDFWHVGNFIWNSNWFDAQRQRDCHCVKIASRLDNRCNEFWSHKLTANNDAHTQSEWTDGMYTVNGQCIVRVLVSHLSLSPFLSRSRCWFRPRKNDETICTFWQIQRQRSALTHFDLSTLRPFAYNLTCASSPIRMSFEGFLFLRSAATRKRMNFCVCFVSFLFRVKNRDRPHGHRVVVFGLRRRR